MREKILENYLKFVEKETEEINEEFRRAELLGKMRAKIDELRKKRDDRIIVCCYIVLFCLVVVGLCEILKIIK